MQNTHKKNIPNLHKAHADFQRRNSQTSPFTASPHTSWRTLCTDSHGTVNKARNSVHRVFLDRLNWKRRKLAMCLSRLTTPLPSTAVDMGEDNPQLDARPTAPVPRCYCQLRLYTDGCFVNSKRNLKGISESVRKWVKATWNSYKENGTLRFSVKDQQ